MQENLLFMRKFFKHGLTIASVWPSSVAMSRATIAKIDWRHARIIVELGAGTVALALLAPLVPLLLPALAGPLLVWPAARDAWLLLVLALACTLLPFTLALYALRHMSAFAAQLATNLEPVYAIVLAALLLGEQHELSATFYAGAAIILGAVFVHPLIGRPRRISQPELLGTAEAKGFVE